MPTSISRDPRPGPLKDDDDALGDLPPLDGEEDEAEIPAEDLEDDEVPSTSGDPFDDATADGHVPHELQIEGSEAGWLDGADEAETLDVGGADLDFDAEEKDLLKDNDEPGTGDEDFGLGGDERVGATDAGEEGFLADDEALREEDLPRLDADDDGEGEDAAFFDLGAEGSGDDTQAIWSAVPWVRVGAPLHVGPVRGLACAARGMFVAGSRMALVDLEGGVEAVLARGLGKRDVARIAFDGAALVAATEGGGLFVSRDAGGIFTELRAWREMVSVEEAAGGLDIALGGGELWGRTSAGKLLVSVDVGTSWEIADVDGFVLAISVDDKGALVALASGLGRVEVLRGRRGALEAMRVPDAAFALEPLGEASVVAWGSAVAFALRSAGIHRTIDGSNWSRIENVTGAVAVEFIDAAGTLLGALVSEGGEHTWLARIGADGASRVVATIDDRGPFDAVVLAWDEAPGVAWVGGSFGLFAFQPVAPHPPSGH